jgi:hypothetical protein
LYHQLNLVKTNNMIILEKPTVEEIQLHFKDAKVVECLANGEHYNVKGGELNLTIGCFWYDLPTDEILKVWNDSQGYAKIIK